MVCFDWTDLHDKTLKIYVGQDEEDGVKTTCVLGVDTETNNSYVLHTNTEYNLREKTDRSIKFLKEFG